MKRPRPRFTVRRMMVAVAILASFLGGIETIRNRGTRFQNLAAYHWGKCPSALGGYDSPHYQWHSDQAKKYRLAATRPWLLVATDTPPPLAIGEKPCLCHYRFSSDDVGWRHDIPLMCEFLEREGWNVSCNERMDGVGGLFDANAKKGEREIEVEGTTEEAAWRKLFKRIGE